jgi:hypothetical protein
VKDDAAWNGLERTDAARAKHREYVTKFSLPAHGVFPVSVEEIAGAAPGAPRRRSPAPTGGGRAEELIGALSPGCCAAPDPAG